MAVATTHFYEGTRSEYVVSALDRPCWNCEKPTDRVEICFEAPLCSAGCVLVKDHEFWSAVSVTTHQGELPI